METSKVDQRFDRLENKIDKLTEVLASVARVEEKLLAGNGRIDRHEFRLDEQEKKLEETVTHTSRNSTIAKIGVWLAGSIWMAGLSCVIFIVRS
jgi:hypothetical protein